MIYNKQIDNDICSFNTKVICNSSRGLSNFVGNYQINNKFSLLNSNYNTFNNSLFELFTLIEDDIAAWHIFYDYQENIHPCNTSDKLLKLYNNLYIKYTIDYTNINLPGSIRPKIYDLPNIELNSVPKLWINYINDIDNQDNIILECIGISTKYGYAYYKLYIPKLNYVLYSQIIIDIFSYVDTVLTAKYWFKKYINFISFNFSDTDILNFLEGLKNKFNQEKDVNNISNILDQFSLDL